MYTDKQLDKIKECLHQLLKDIDNNSIQYRQNGVCCNLDNYTEDCGVCAYAFVGENSSDWEHFSGKQYDPVGGYYSIPFLWEGEQLQLRISLIHHLINKCETLKGATK